MNVNEKAGCTINVVIKDENKQVVIPDAFNYALADKDSGIVLTSGSKSPASSVNIAITPNQNRILDQGKPSETRVLTVVAPYDGTNQATGEYQYKVVNLKGVDANTSTSPSASVSPSASPSAG